MARGEPAVAALEARPLQGQQGLGHELGVFLLVPFMLLTWDFFGNCLLAAPELIKALPSPSCLARSGFGEAGAD